MNIHQLKQVIERLQTRIPLTDSDKKFDRMIFFKHGEGVHISEYDAWIAIVMEAAEKYSKLEPLVKKIFFDQCSHELSKENVDRLEPLFKQIREIIYEKKEAVKGK